MGPPLVYDSHVSLEKYFFFVAPVIDAIIPTRTYVGKRTCAHPFSTWHAIVSQLSSLSTRYTTGGANHAPMQRRIQADSMFPRRYSFVEKANLVAIVRTRMTEDRVSFSQAVDSVGVPLSTLYVASRSSLNPKHSSARSSRPTKFHS